MQGFQLNVTEGIADRRRLLERRALAIDNGPVARVKVSDALPASGVTGRKNMLREKGKEYIEPLFWAKEAEKAGKVEILDVPKMGEAKLAQVTVRKKNWEWQGLLRNYNVRLLMLQEDADRFETLGDVKVVSRFKGDLSQVTV